MSNAKENYQVIDRYGNPVRGNVVPDGGSVKVALMLADGAPASLSSYLSDDDMPGRTPRAPVTDTTSAGHKPGFVSVPVVDKAKSIANHLGRKKRLSDAWRNPDPAPAVLDGGNGDQARPAQRVQHKATDAESAYAARSARLASAWK